jgi:hypothetical protein
MEAKWTHYNLMTSRRVFLKARIEEVVDGIARIVDENGVSHACGADRVHLIWAPLPKEQQIKPSIAEAGESA